MSVRLNHLHWQYAQRRESENHRVERKQEVNRYYDHWGKVTTRYDNWTNPEYYENADKKLQKRKEQADKEKSLETRRSRLRLLFADEGACYEREMKLRNRPRPRKLPEDVNALDRVSQTLKEREQIKRKLEMEAKLYGRWRHGVDDESLLFDTTKSDNQVLAKLNWLDKQIEEQVQRERDEALAQERNLRLQEQIQKTEQTQKERQQIREQEIKEIRALQERHMTEMKERQQQSDSLKEEETHLRMFVAEVGKERELLEESNAVILQQPDYSQAFNLKRIKVFIRNRSETYRKQLRLCINMLERVGNFCTKRENVQTLLQQYQEQLEADTLAFAQIEVMYESEAKLNLQRCEDTWRDQHLTRYNELKQLLDGEASRLAQLIEENVRQQKEVVKLRSTHLAAIENSNEKLKNLYREQEDSIGGASSLAAGLEDASTVGDPPAVPSDGKRVNNFSDKSAPNVTQSFSNLNLDCWQNMPPTRSDDDFTRLSKTRSMNVVTADTAERPKFARKRVAWT